MAATAPTTAPKQRGQQPAAAKGMQKRIRVHAAAQHILRSHAGKCRDRKCSRGCTVALHDQRVAWRMRPANHRLLRFVAAAIVHHRDTS